MSNRKSFAWSTVTVAPSPANSGGTLQIQTGHGLRFPAVPFKAVIHAPTSDSVGASEIATDNEIVLVTAMSGDSITAMSRGYDGSTARAIAVGDEFYVGLLASDLDEVLSEALSAVASADAHASVASLAATSVDARVTSGDAAVSAQAASANLSLDALRSTLSDKVVSISAQIVSVDARATSLKSRLSGLSTSVTNISNTLSVVSARSIGVSTKGLQSALNAVSNTISNEVSARQSASAALDLKISTLSDKVTSVSAQLVSLETHASTASAAATSVDSRIASLSVVFASLSGRSAGGASTHGLQSIINALSNRISAVTGGTGSVTSNEVSAGDASVLAAAIANDASVSAAIRADEASHIASTSATIKADIASVSAAIKADIASVSALLAAGMIQLQNVDSVDVSAGCPVYSFTSANTFKRARDTDDNTLTSTRVIGLVADSLIAVSATGKIQTQGPITLTSAQWDDITGQTGGLVPGTLYAMDNTTTGKLQAGSGSETPVGIALSPTTLKLMISFADDVWGTFIPWQTSITNKISNLQSDLLSTQDDVFSVKGRVGIVSTIANNAGAKLASLDQVSTRSAGVSTRGLANGMDALSNTISLLSVVVAGLVAQITSIDAQLTVAISAALASLEVHASAASAAATSALAAAIANDASVSAAIRADEASHIASTSATIKADIASVSAVIKADIASVSAAIKTDIASVSAAIRADEASHIASTSATIKTDIASVSAVLAGSIQTASAAATSVDGRIASLSAAHASLSVRTSTGGATSIHGFQSIFDALSNQISDVLTSAKTVETAVSNVSIAISGTSATGLQNVIDRISAAFGSLSNLSVRTSTGGATSIRGMQSVLDALSNQASDVLTSVKTVENAISNVSIAISGTSATGLQNVIDRISAAFGSLSNISARTQIGGATSIRGLQSVIDALSGNIASLASGARSAVANVSIAISGTSATGLQNVANAISAAFASLSNISARTSISGATSIRGMQSVINALSAQAADAMSVASAASAQLASISAQLGTRQLLKITNANQTIAGTAFTTISGLGVSLAANGTYAVEGQIIYTLSVVTGVAFAFAYNAAGNNQISVGGMLFQCFTSTTVASSPGAATLFTSTMQQWGILGANAAGQMSNAVTAAVSILGGTSTTQYMLHVKGVINAVSAFTMNLQAKVSASGNGVQIMQGSYIQAFRTV